MNAASGLPARTLFLHANGFPTGVYRQFLDALGAHTEIIDLPIIDTPTTLPGARRWQAMRDSLRPLIQRHGDDGCALVGHSMGGYLALILAADALPARHPVVMIDSPMVIGWRGAIFSFSRLTGLSYRLGPAPIAQRRRDHWPNAQAAHEFFAGKAFVKRWAPGVLDDYIAQGLAPHTSSDATDGAMRLRIPRETERDIYANLAHRAAVDSLRKLRAAGQAPGFIAGTYSRELKMAGRSGNRRLFRDRWRELPASHLIPMELPNECAQAVIEMLEPGTFAPDSKAIE